MGMSSVTVVMSSVTMVMSSVTVVMSSVTVVMESLMVSGEKSPIAERYLTPRRDALDAGVVALEDATDDPAASGDQREKKGKSWCCLVA